MGKFLFFAVLLAGMAFADDNYNGLLDTAIITGFKADSLKYTKGFPLSKFEDIRVILKVDDTAKAGFYEDSVDIQWGWQTFSRCLDTSGSMSSPDTCFDQRVIADTLDTASMAVTTLGYADSTGDVYRTHKWSDTNGCAGYAIQGVRLYPEWDHYIRFWVQGLVGNNRVAGGALKVQFDVKRRTFINVRSK